MFGWGPYFHRISLQLRFFLYISVHLLLKIHPKTKHNTNNSYCDKGDVYRRDEIDRSHYPVFHQMEGVRMFPELKGKSREEADKIVGN
jgi:hypothetical protein